MKKKTMFRLTLTVICVFSLGATAYYIKPSHLNWASLKGLWMKQFAQNELKTNLNKAELYKKGVIRGARLAHHNEIEICYQNYLSMDPKVQEGMVNLQWGIDYLGRANEVQVKLSELEDFGLNDCLVKTVGDMEFQPPPTQEGVVISYKFHFKKRSPASLDFSQ